MVQTNSFITLQQIYNHLIVYHTLTKLTITLQDTICEYEVLNNDYN